MTDLRVLASERLMALYRERRDPAAMEALVDRFARPALAAARQLIADPAQVEDAVQETFLRLVRAPRAYDPARPFAPWFFAVLRNVCRDLSRQRARRDALLQEAAVRIPIPVGGDGALPEEMLSPLECLGRIERAVLTLRLVDGLDFETIAVALGISHEAAKKRAQRGLRRLRARCTALGT